MRKKHNPKITITVGICLLLAISVVVINAHDMQTISRVKVSNKNIVISQGNTEITNAGSFGNQNVGVNSSGTNFNNANAELNNQGMNVNNSGTQTGNRGRFSNQGGFSNTGNYSNTGTYGGNNGIFGNSNAGRFGNQNGQFGNTNVGIGNNNYRTEADKYKYQDIDWSTWKSNFVNRILDDSMYITSLDNYGVGTWFYYSFVVTDTGLIKDVTVMSFYLKDEDKKAVRDLIRSYVHTPITIFPKDSRRKKVKVKAIMLLGNSESKSDASNFNDIEKIKIKY